MAQAATLERNLGTSDRARGFVLMLLCAGVGVVAAILHCPSPALAETVVTASARPAAAVHGDTVVIAGRVSPAPRGASVLLQARRGRAWRKLGRPQRARRGRFRLRQRIDWYGERTLRVSVRPTRPLVTSAPLSIVGLGRKTVASRGRTLRLRLGDVRIHAPKGAIRRGQTLTLAVGGDPAFGPHGLRSVGGGTYRLTTSQGQPRRPVRVTMPYDPSAVAPGSRPILLHGDAASQAWLPEVTRTHKARRTVTATLSSFSPIDVVDYVTWAAGDLTGNRTDLPSGCGSAPVWIEGVTLSMNRNDPLTACVSSKTRPSGDTLYLNLVNNRGFAQMISVAGGSVDVTRSLWSDSVEGIAGQALARLLTHGTGTYEFMLAPGSKATVAIPRPARLVGWQTVTLTATDPKWNAAGSLVFSLLKFAARKQINPGLNTINCLMRATHFARAEQVEPGQTLATLRACIDSATGISGVAKDALRRIAVAVLTTDLLFKIVDAGADGAYAGRAAFTFRGLSPTNPNLRPTGLELGTLPAGATTEHQLGATGGTPPYRFRISKDAVNAGRAPAWVTLATDGRLTISPPAGTTRDVGFYVTVTDATGRSSATAHWIVSFSIEPDTSPAAGTYQLMSTTPGGAAGDAFSVGADISADGRYVAFESLSSDLAPGQQGQAYNVYVRDRLTGVNERISRGPGGEPASGWSHHPAITPDGRYVVFISSADNLVPDDTNAGQDWFVYDRATQVTERVSVATDESQADTADQGLGDDHAAISDDGRFVAFDLDAPNLAGDDGNGTLDVFVRDRQLGTTELVSRTASGVAGNGRSAYPAMSADGRYVAFGSTAPDLVAGDGNNASDVFLRDRETGSLAAISVTPGGSLGSTHSAYPSVSGEGRYIAFMSNAQDLVASDTNGPGFSGLGTDVFVRDITGGTTLLVDTNSSGVQSDGDAILGPTLTPDGSHLLFASKGSNLADSDENDDWDVFWKDLDSGETRLVSHGSSQNGPPYYQSLAMSDDATTVAFSTSAALDAADFNETNDVYLRSFPPPAP